MLSTGVIIVLLLVVGIWVLVELKRMRHKIFAVFLIALILFTYISFTSTIKSNNVDMGTVDGFVKGTRLYFAWLGSAFSNMKLITTNAIRMDWSGEQNSNKTISTSG